MSTSPGQASGLPQVFDTPAGVVDRNGELYMRVGGDDAAWQPSASGCADYREYAAGEGWKV